MFSFFEEVEADQDSKSGGKTGEPVRMPLEGQRFFERFWESKKQKNAGAVAKAGGPERLPLTTSANLICYNSRDHRS